jgi:hypothetical protein
MQLQLYPYRRRIFAHDVVPANAAVISGAVLGSCCCNQSSYQDQTQHLGSGKVKLPSARFQTSAEM